MSAHEIRLQEEGDALRRAVSRRVRRYGQPRRRGCDQRAIAWLRGGGRRTEGKLQWHCYERTADVFRHRVR